MTETEVGEKLARVAGKPDAADWQREARDREAREVELHALRLRESEEYRVREDTRLDLARRDVETSVAYREGQSALALREVVALERIAAALEGKP